MLAESLLRFPNESSSISFFFVIFEVRFFYSNVENYLVGSRSDFVDWGRSLQTSPSVMMGEVVVKFRLCDDFAEFLYTSAKYILGVADVVYFTSDSSVSITRVWIWLSFSA